MQLGRLLLLRRMASAGLSDSLQNTIGVTNTVISTNLTTERGDNQQSMPSSDINLVDVNCTHPAVGCISHVSLLNTYHFFEYPFIGYHQTFITDRPSVSM